jgi:hypothetical protein
MLSTCTIAATNMRTATAKAQTAAYSCAAAAAIFCKYSVGPTVTSAAAIFCGYKTGEKIIYTASCHVDC